MSYHVHNEAVADPARIAERLDAVGRDGADLRLVEVDGDPDRYRQGHVPGAVGLDWERELQEEGSVVGRGGFEALAASSGITEDTTVVVYGDGTNRFAAHAYWVFEYYGHGDVRLLDGGRCYWESEGYPLTTEAPTFTARSYEAATPDDGGVAAAALGAPTGGIAEVTASATAGGSNGSPTDGTPADLSQAAVTRDGRFKPEADLRGVYADYCGEEGPTVPAVEARDLSPLTWFVLAELLDCVDPEPTS